MNCILASTSPYRKNLLQRLGVKFETVAPDVCESDYKAQIKDPLRLSQTLAEAKAQSVFKNHPKACVIGSDQVAALGKMIFDKPGNAHNAIVTLQKLSGKTHQLLTSVCLLTPSEKYIFTDQTTLSMKSLREEQILAYIEADNPFDCAGAYKLESRGIALFDKIDSQDFTAIQGLPLIELGKQLERLGFELF